MRKDRERQKKRTGKQLNLFRDQYGPVGGSDGRTGRRTLSGVELSSQSEEKQTLTKDLLEQVVDYGRQLGLLTPRIKLVTINENRRGTRTVCQVVWGDSGFLPLPTRSWGVSPMYKNLYSIGGL